MQDLNVTNHPTTDPENDPELMANPLRAFLLALAADLVSAVATLNAMPGNRYTTGEAAALKRALARAVEHSYGTPYVEAFRRVDDAAKRQVGKQSTGDMGWERVRNGIYERVVAMILDSEWEPGTDWQPQP